MTTAHRLGEHFVQLVGEGACHVVPVGPHFWSAGIADLPPGRLVSVIETSASWPTWERHPAGEELIIQLSGVLTLILDGPAPSSVTLRPGEFVVVPAGVWHTADAEEPSRAIYITPGDGTEVRERRAEG